jgi:hypothetical protein
MARIQTALTPTQLNHKRGTAWRGTQYVSVSRPITVFQAVVSQSITADPLAEVQYHNATGAYSAVKAGMTVLIGERFIGRVRQTPTSNTLYINETSIQFSAGDVIQVVDDYRPHGILGRVTQGAEVIDWDQPYQGLRPMIRNLPAVRVGWVSASTDDKLQLSFAPTAYAVEHGAMIDNGSWQWQLPTGVTLHSGTLTQPNITVRCVAGEHWLHVSVADSEGATSTRHIKIFTHDWETFPPLTTVDGISIEATLDNGINATIPSFAGMDDLPDRTLVTVWTDAEYEHVPVPPRIDAHGRLSRRSSGAEGDFQYHNLPHDVTAQISGVAEQMSAIEAPKIAIRDHATPSAWGEINRPTLWRIVWHVLDRYSTLTSLYEIAFDDLSDHYIHPSPVSVGSGQLLNALNQLLSALNGGMQFAPDGVIECVRDGRWLSSNARDSLGVVATWDERDALSYDAEHETGGQVGFVQAFGASWNSATQTSTPLSAIAPGLAFGAGDTSVSLNEQVLRSNVSASVAQAELIERAGHEYAYRNAGDSLTVTLPDGYSDLLPARNIWHVWTLDDLQTIGNRWLLTRLTYRHDNETGGRDVQATFALETAGRDGQAYRLPPADGVESVIPTFPPFDVYPAFPEMPNVVFPSNDPIHIPPVTTSPIAPAVPARDGNVVMTWNDFDVWLTQDYKKSNSPTWTRITPPIDVDEIITDASFGKGTQAFVVSYNNLTDQSRIWRTSTIFNAAHLWKAGEAVTGKLDLLRVASPPDTLYLTGQTIEPPIEIEWTQTFDFSGGMQGWTINQNNPTGSLTYVSGSGFKLETLASGNSQTRLMLNLAPRPTLSTDHQVNFVEVSLIERNLTTPLVIGTPFLGDLTIPAGTIDLVASKTGSASSGNNYYYLSFNNNFRPVGDTVTVEKLTFKGTGINPFVIEPDYMQVFDFTQGTQGFVIEPYSSGQTLEYVVGQGFKHTMEVDATRSATISKSYPFTPARDIFITKIRIDYERNLNWTRGTDVNTGYGGNIQLYVTAGTTAGFIETTGWISRRNLDRLTVTFSYNWNVSSPNPTDYWVTVKKLTIWGISKAGTGNPFIPPAQALLAYSDDNGESITIHPLGDPPTLGMIGLDAVTIGDRAYIGVDGEILQTENADEPTPYATLPADLGVAGGAIIAPRYQANGDSNALDDPDLIVASPVLSDDDESVWRITDEGDTLTDITPELSGGYGVIASPNSLSASWQKPERMALIAVIDDEKHLLTWDGSGWVDCGTLGEYADYVRMRKQDSAGRELYFVDEACQYSPDYGATVITKQSPDEIMKGISIYG